jgi:hypothetical protein
MIRIIKVLNVEVGKKGDPGKKEGNLFQGSNEFRFWSLLFEKQEEEKTFWIPAGVYPVLNTGRE